MGTGNLGRRLSAEINPHAYSGYMYWMCVTEFGPSNASKLSRFSKRVIDALSPTLTLLITAEEFPRAWWRT